MSKSLYTLSAVLFIILITCYADSSNTSTLCAPSECGNITIHYPFWRRSNTIIDGEFCGYPDFGLECSQGQAIITLPSDTYYVTDINYDTYSLTLVDIDILNQPCPRAQHSVSLATLPLSFSSLDLNLSFYFNCRSYPSFVDPIGCLRHDNDSRKSYVFVEGDETDDFDWHKNCMQHVVVTVKDDEIDISGGGGGLINGFGAAMKKGFVLDWNRAEDCAECELSGGYCGYHQNTKQSKCICGNGSIVAKSCKKGTLVLAS